MRAGCVVSVPAKTGASIGSALCMLVPAWVGFDKGSGSWERSTLGVVWMTLDMGSCKRVRIALISRLGWGVFLEGTGGSSSSEWIVSVCFVLGVLILLRGTCLRLYSDTS